MKRQSRYSQNQRGLRVICALFVVWLFRGWAEESLTTEYYVVNKLNRPVYGAAISADGDGNISLRLASGATQNFRPGAYLSAHCPKPGVLATASQLLDQGQWMEALALLEPAYAEFRYLGWAGKIGQMKGRALSALGRHSEAIAALEESLASEADELQQSKLQAVLIDSLIGAGEYDRAQQRLAELKSLTPDAVAFRHNRLGRILDEKGQKKEAVLQYLKTVLLVDRSSRFRKPAYEQVIALMKEMKDERYREYEKRMREEYPE